MMKNKSLWWSVAVMVSLFAITFIVSCSSDGGGGDGGGQAKWTVMLYGAGNNSVDLDSTGRSYIVQDVQDMEKVGSQDGVNMVAMVSRVGGNARIYEIELFPDDNLNVISSPERENLGTRDMSSPLTLQNFLNYCKENFPADRYHLIIDDHGAGWEGSCEETSGGLLTLDETREGISQSDLGSVDIVTWNASSMSMVEVAYELRNVCEFMTGGQFTLQMQNVLGADLWLDWLVDNQDATNEDYAREIVEGVIARAESKERTTHYAMIKMSEMQNLKDELGSFGVQLAINGDLNWDEMEAALNGAAEISLDGPAFLDINEFTSQIQAQPTLGAIGAINSGAVDVRNALNSAVPFTDSYFHPSTTPVTRGGLSVYLPREIDEFVVDSAAYAELQWEQSNWPVLISAFLRQSLLQQCGSPCENAGAYTVGDVVNWCSISPGVEHYFYTTLSVGIYRFQLTALAGGNLDCFTIAGGCNGSSGCFRDGPGNEDFECLVTAPIEIAIAIVSRTATGPYEFSITR